MRFVFLFFICTSIAFASDTLQSIKVTGNERLDSDDIISQLKLETGSSINDAQLNQLFKRLYSTGLFSELAFSLDDGILSIKVKENPIINKIKIVGNRFIKSSTISKVLQVKEFSNVNISNLDSSINEIKSLYRFRGRPSTDVTYDIKRLAGSSVDIVINIKEKKSLKIAKVRFHGNEVLSDQDLRMSIHSREFSIFRIINQSYNFVQEMLDVDKQLLKRFYLSKGYFDFNIEDTKVTKEGEWVYIDFYLNEGKLYRFGEVKVGNVIAGIDIDKVSRMIGIKSNQTFSIDLVNNASANITNYLNEHGYLFANVVPSYNENGNVVDVTFSISEGKRIYIDAINIRGNSRTLDSVIRKKLIFAEREPYNINKIKISRYIVLRLGIFDDVTLSEKYSKDSADSVDIDIDVKERSTGFMNISGGYNSEIGMFANIGYTESSLFGTGNPLSFSFKRSVRDLEGSFSLNKSHIFDTDITGGIAVSSRDSDRSDESSYKMSDNGFKLSAGYSITRNLSNTVFYSYQRVNTYDIGGDVSDTIKNQEGITNISLVGYSLTHNALDNIIDPANGHIAILGQDLAGIFGGLDFLRSEFKFSYFKQIAPSVVFNFRTRSGYIFGYAGDTVKIGQRFFANEVRGFDSSGIGPRILDIHPDGRLKRNEALGGNKYLFNTVQLFFPVGLPKELGIKGSIFFDNAILTSVDSLKSDDDKVKDSASFRNAVGVGFIWDSPFGKLTLDFGLPITKEPYDKVKTIKIGVSKPV